MFFFFVVVVVGEPDAFQLGQPNEGLVVDVQQDGAPFAVERLDAEVLQARKSNEGPRWKCPDFAVLNLQGFQFEQASKVVGAEVQLEEEDVGAGEVKGIGPAQLRLVLQSQVPFVVQRPFFSAFDTVREAMLRTESWFDLRSTRLRLFLLRKVLCPMSLILFSWIRMVLRLGRRESTPRDLILFRLASKY